MSYISMDLDTTVFDSINFPFIVTYWVDTLENVIIKFLPNNTYYLTEGNVKFTYDTIANSLKVKQISYDDYNFDRKDNFVGSRVISNVYFSYGIYYTRGDTLYLRPDFDEDLKNLEKAFAVYKKEKDKLKFIGYKNKISDKEVFNIKGKNLRHYHLDSTTGKYNRVYPALKEPIYDFIKKNGAYRNLIKIKSDTLYVGGTSEYITELVKIDTTVKKGEKLISYVYGRKKVAINIWKVLIKREWKINKKDKGNKKLKYIFDNLKFNEDNSFIFYDGSGEKEIKGTFLIVKNIVRLYYKIKGKEYITDYILYYDDDKSAKFNEEKNTFNYTLYRFRDFNFSDGVMKVYDITWQYCGSYLLYTIYDYYYSINEDCGY